MEISAFNCLSLWQCLARRHLHTASTSSRATSGLFDQPATNPSGCPLESERCPNIVGRQGWNTRPQMGLIIRHDPNNLIPDATYQEQSIRAIGCVFHRSKASMRTYLWTRTRITFWFIFTIFYSDTHFYGILPSMWPEATIVQYHERFASSIWNKQKPIGKFSFIVSTRSWEIKRMECRHIAWVVGEYVTESNCGW